MKFMMRELGSGRLESLPVRGAWIEIAKYGA